jgi:ATP-dependent DNA helicase RecG
VRIAFLTGRDGQKPEEADPAGPGRNGTIQLVVGTHALVQEDVEFADLALAVVDEQHRFGVHQRMALVV